FLKFGCQFGFPRLGVPYESAYARRRERHKLPVFARPEFLFHALSCRDIDARADPFAHRAVGIAHGHAAHVEIPITAVAQAHAELGVVFLAGPYGFLPALRHARTIVGVDEIEPAAAPRPI